MQSRIHIVVSGLVQGVGFRWFAQRRAGAMGLSGYVKNRVDGSVELEAQGERSAVEEFLREVRVGPRSAQVSDCRIEWMEGRTGETGFTIR